MKKQSIIVTTLAIIAVAAIVMIAWGTATLLSSIDGGKSNDSTNSSGSQDSEKNDPAPTDISTFGNPVIDEQLNKEAELLDDEAAGLMESDPKMAQRKYHEAAKAYKKAGNVSKVSEMQANAMTAELLAEEK